MAITVTQLRSFLAVVKTGSVSAAAEELVVTQPSVSAAVSALSRELGVELTERRGRGVRPSPAGEAFAGYAADVIGLLEQGRRAARETTEEAASELRIAAVTTAGEHIIPALIEAFSARTPDAKVSVEVGNRQRVLTLVRSHAADIAFGGRPPRGEGVEGTRFLENPIVLIAAPNDPLAEASNVDVSELADRPWLLREEGSGTRAMTEEFLAANNLQPRILTLGSNGAIKQAVRGGLGVSLQSRLAVELELELELLATVDVRSALPSRHWYMLRPATGPVRPVVEEFVNFVRSSDGRSAVEQANRSGAAPRLAPLPATDGASRSSDGASASSDGASASSDGASASSDGDSASSDGASSSGGSRRSREAPSST